jgi:hypothetical protein
MHASEPKEGDRADSTRFSYVTPTMAAPGVTSPVRLKSVF